MHAGWHRIKWVVNRLMVHTCRQYRREGRREGCRQGKRQGKGQGRSGCVVWQGREGGSSQEEQTRYKGRQDNQSKGNQEQKELNVPLE
jgi:hypothetical protein